MSQPLHTPYDGSSKPFTIGLKPFDINHWLDIDDQLAAYLAEKQRLIETHYNDIVVSEPGSEAAQQEVLDLVTNHICERHTHIYQRNQSHIEIKLTGQSIDLNDSSINKLHLAASLIQDDLVIMRRDETGWRLVAASLCFPSAWNLREKFGKPMQEIHTPVPGFGTGTRNAALIERMFDNLKAEQPVMRWNWSLYGDDLLYHPHNSGEGKLRFGTSKEPENIHLRLERQTLRKLAHCQDLLFTIRIFIDPLQTIQASPEGPALAAAIADQLAAMSDPEIAYKGVASERERLVNHLRSIAGLLK